MIWWIGEVNHHLYAIEALLVIYCVEAELSLVTFLLLQALWRHDGDGFCDVDATWPQETREFIVSLARSEREIFPIIPSETTFQYVVPSISLEFAFECHWYNTTIQYHWIGIGIDWLWYLSIQPGQSGDNLWGRILLSILENSPYLHSTGRKSKMRSLSYLWM